MRGTLAAGPPGSVSEALRMLASLAWVAATAALALAAAGALPRWLAGETPDVRAVASLEEAERRLGARLLAASYSPERLGWPPAEVRVAGGRGGAAAYTLRAREGSDLQLLQATTPGTPIPPPLLAVTRQLSTSRATVGAHPATLARVLADGITWEELRWEHDGRALVLRTQGDHEELLRIARSIHPRGAR